MKRSLILVIAAVLMWGTLATAAKLLVGMMSNLCVSVYTCFFASVTLFLYNLITGNLKKLATLPASILWRMVLIGSLGIFLCNTVFYAGTKRLPAQEALVINELWPALTVIFSHFLLNEKLTIPKIIAILFSFAGIIIVVTNGSFDNLKSTDPAGILYCVAAAVFYALYTVLGKREGYDKGIAVFIAFLAGFITALILALLRGEMIIPNKRELAILIFNGTVSNALPFLCWAIAMDISNTAVLANMAYLTPVVSLFVTHYVLGEAITIYSVLGLVLVILGILFQMYLQREKTETPA